MNVRSSLATIALLAWSLASAPAGRADTVPLAAIATAQVPTARAHRPLGSEELARMRTVRAAPRMLAGGTLADGSTAVRWEFHRSGRFTEPGHEPPDMRVLAERLRGTADEWSFAGWRVPPVFDREHHVLFWAYDVKHPEGRRTLSFAAFLTREGVLLFQRTSANLGAFEREEAAFRRLLATVRVNEGRRWEDFRASDALASSNVEDLVANRGVPLQSAAAEVPKARDRARPTAPSPGAAKAGTWISVALGVLIGLRVLLLLARFLRARRHAAEEIRMPTEAGGVSLPKPIEPEEPRGR